MQSIVVFEFFQDICLCISAGVRNKFVRLSMISRSAVIFGVKIKENLRLITHVCTVMCCLIVSLLFLRSFL